MTTAGRFMFVVVPVIITIKAKCVHQYEKIQFKRDKK